MSSGEFTFEIKKQPGEQVDTVNEAAEARLAAVTEAVKVLAERLDRVDAIDWRLTEPMRTALAALGE